MKKLCLIIGVLVCGCSYNEPGQKRLFDIADQSYIVTWDNKASLSAYPERVETLENQEIFFDKFSPLLDDGTYMLSLYPEMGEGYIGHQWYNKRFIRALSIEFMHPENMPDSKDVSLSYWVGETSLQGYWSNLPGDLIKEAKGFRYVINNPESEILRVGTYKVRWFFRNTTIPYLFTRLSAYTEFDFKDVTLKISCDGFKGKTTAGIINGEFIGAENGKKVEIDLGDERDLRVLCGETGRCKIERTVLYFDLPGSGKFGVAVEDIMRDKGVYIKGCGLYIRMTGGPGFSEFKAERQGRKSILEQVRAMDDQCFENVISKTHQANENRGPAMLSLACNNNKFVVREDGSIRYFRNFDAPVSHRKSNRGHLNEFRYDILEVTPYYGSLEPSKGHKREWPWFSSPAYPAQTRRLIGDYYPAPLHTVTHEGVTYCQGNFVAPAEKTDTAKTGQFGDVKSVFVSKFILENRCDSARQATLKLVFEDNIRTHDSPEMRGDEKVMLGKGDLKLGVVDLRGAKDLQCTQSSGEITVEGQLGAGQKREVVVYIPGWDCSEMIEFGSPDELLGDMKSYWDRFLDSGVHIEVPEKRLENLIKAGRINCSITARNELGGECISPWCSGAHFGVIDSESQSVVDAMSMMGHEDFARNALDFFIRRYDHNGKLSTGYTLMGMGWHLRVLGQHFMRYRDQEWLTENQEKISKMCEWILDQQEETKMETPGGEMVLEYGLMPPGTSADWPALLYGTRIQTEFYSGLVEAGKALKLVNNPGADEYMKRTREFKANIVRSYEQTRQKSPAVPIGDHVYVPYCPAVLTQLGSMGDILNFSAKDCSMGGQHMVVCGVLDADSPDGYFKADRFEHVFFMEASPYFDHEQVREDWFNKGGYYRGQPYYSRIIDVYALNDDVKPFIRAYFNNIAPIVNLEVLTFWEHLNGTGGWNKTHETGWFLYHTRQMLVEERGNDLMLGGFITTHWMGEGMRVAAKEMPTSFGKVSYEIRSQVDDGYIEAEITPPVRKKPDTIVIRLRHPQEKKFKAITVNGHKYDDFDREKDIVRLKDFNGEKVTIRAMFD